MINKLKNHSTYLKKGVNQLDFKTVFICDDLISIGIGQNGINQLSYHGTQPVSRNAYIMRSNKTQAISFHINNKKVDLTNLFVSSYGFISDKEMICGFASHKSLIIEAINKNKELKVILNEENLYKNVHGKREWTTKTIENELIYIAHDFYKLVDWVKENGCFLVNVNDHFRLFNVNEGVDVNNSDEELDIKYSNIEKNEMFFDSYVYMTINKINNTISSISFGDSLKDLRKEKKRIKNHYRNIIKNQILRYEKLKEKQPIIKFSESKEIGELMKLIPFYAESTKLSCRNIIRASASDYYWVWGWDSLVSLNEFSKWNDLTYQKKALRFYKKNMLEDGSLPHRWNRDFNILQSGKFGYTECLFIILVWDLYSKSNKKQIVKKYYKDILNIYEKLNSKRRNKTLLQGLGVYPDSPYKLGRTREGFVAMDNSAFYMVSNIINNMAHILRDKKTISKTNDNMIFYENNFMNVFFDNKIHTLIDHVDSKLKFDSKTYPSYSFIANYNKYGYLLYLKKINEIASFFNREYILSNGVRNLPKDDKNVFSEPIHNAWYPHWDIYVIKYLRLNSNSEALKKYINSLVKMWNSCGCVMELLDLKEKGKKEVKEWLSHGQPWNINCATAVYKTIFDSVIGIISDFNYIKIVENGVVNNISISNIIINKKKINIRIGKGDFVIPKVILNNKEIKGTLVLPTKNLLKTDNNLVVNFGIEQKKYPVILEIWQLQMKNIRITDNKLNVSIKGNSNSKLLLYSSKKLNITFNNKKISYEDYNNNRYLVFIKGKGELVAWEN